MATVRKASITMAIQRRPPASTGRDSIGAVSMLLSLRQVNQFAGDLTTPRHNFGNLEKQLLLRREFH
jgi:hypothetical protein